MSGGRGGVTPHHLTSTKRGSNLLQGDKIISRDRETSTAEANRTTPGVDGDDITHVAMSRNAGGTFEGNAMTMGGLSGLEATAERQNNSVHDMSGFVGRSNEASQVNLWNNQ